MTPAEELASRKPSRKRHLQNSKPPRKRKWKTNIRDVREQHRLSLKDVAVAIDLSVNGLWQIEYGTDPLLTTAVKLAAFYGLGIEDLWQGLLKD